MSKLQPIKFNSLEDFYSFLPKNELEIVKALTSIIENNISHYKVKLSYNVPFFYGKKRILFIWPASVPWGNVKKDGVRIGFCNGYLINDEQQYLEKGSRKQIFTKTFFNIKEINIDLLKSFIHQAVEIDLKQ